MQSPETQIATVGDESKKKAEKPVTGSIQDLWPSLPYEEWKDTYDTLHMWIQIVAKIRLTLSPVVNHWWHSSLYVTPRGLTTSPIPYAGRTFEIQFDFIDHNLKFETSDGMTRFMALYPRSVADFYREVMAVTRSLGIEVRINPIPQEVANPIRCDQDEVHAYYDAEYVERFRRILIQTDQVLKEFRGRFMGKSSPVHFWWGSFDLAVTRFSGRRAPERPGADWITREAYSYECSSAGFWPGSGHLLKPAFYAYTVPAPPGFNTASIRPEKAYFDSNFSEFILLYDDVRTSDRPADDLLDFLQSTYEVGANLGNWDRSNLEREP
ncbi:MAG TPA: DUF5996 family protein [Anaerolineales bacterium]